MRGNHCSVCGGGGSVTPGPYRSFLACIRAACMLLIHDHADYGRAKGPAGPRQCCGGHCMDKFCVRDIRCLCRGWRERCVVARYISLNSGTDEASQASP